MRGNKQAIAKKIVNIMLDILIVLLGIILLITIYNNIQIKLLGNDYASFFGHSVFEVQTGSMEPEISAGDWIIVKYEKNIALNDIVTFEHKGQYVTHRVIESYNGTYVTKGDANNAKDTPIGKDKIIGKVTKILPYFGILRKTIFNPIVLIFLIITCYLLGITFKKTSEQEQELERELLEIIKRKFFRKKETPIIESVIDKEVAKLKEEQQEIKEAINEELKEEKEPITKQAEKVSGIIQISTNDDDYESEDEIEELEESEEIKFETEEEVEELVGFENTEEVENEEDLDKTVFYRMVSVSEEELSEAYNTPIMIEENVEDPKEEVVEEITEDEVKSTLELIQRKKKKCKNFIEKAMYIKEQEIEEIIDCLNLNEKEKANEPSIKSMFIKYYVDAKYYNNCGEISVDYTSKNMITLIEGALKTYKDKVIKEYKGTDKTYAEKVEKYLNYILVVNHFEQMSEVDESIDEKRKHYLTKLKKYIKMDISDKDIKDLLTTIIKIQKKYKNMINFLLGKLTTGMFELEITKTVEKNLYAVDLKHNIEFSKVYSDYIVDKTYSEGVVAEDKVEVLASLLLAQLVKNMLNKEYKNKYLIYIPSSLYEKESKLIKTFKLFNDEYVKNNLNIVLNYDDLAKRKKIIKQLKKQGYNFSVDMTTTDKVKKTDEAMLHIVDYIFITKEQATKTNIIEIIPEGVKSKITYDDISSKIGNVGGK